MTYSVWLMQTVCGALARPAGAQMTCGVRARGRGRDLTRAGAVLFGAGIDVALAHEWSRGAALGRALKALFLFFGICGSTLANCGMGRVRWKHSPGW